MAQQKHTVVIVWGERPPHASSMAYIATRADWELQLVMHNCANEARLFERMN